MTEEELEKRIAAANKEYVTDDTDAPQAAEPVDYFNKMAVGIRDMAKRGVTNGARPKLSVETTYIMRNLKKQFKMAEHSREMAIGRGDKLSARLLGAQYMHEVFLPAVDAIVKLNSVEELLNSKDLLERLDGLVLAEGSDSAPGFTRAFLQSMYQSDEQHRPAMSDSCVRKCMNDIAGLMARGQVRTAVGTAKKMLKKIDAGQQIAIDDDYLVLQKVALRG